MAGDLTRLWRCASCIRILRTEYIFFCKAGALLQNILVGWSIAIVREYDTLSRQASQGSRAQLHELKHMDLGIEEGRAGTHDIDDSNPDT